MDVTARPIERVPLTDEPVNKDLFHGKGHERTAAALVRAIETHANRDKAIGLDGVWGSGKSTVVGIAEAMLRRTSSASGSSYRFFTFDVWKSQGAAFRRSFLEHFIAWARKDFPAHSSKLTEIEKRVRGKTRQVDSDNHTVLDWFGILILSLIPLIPIYLLWTKYEFDEYAKAKSLGQFMISLPTMAIYVLMLLGALSILKRYRSFDSSLDVTAKTRREKWRIAISQTLLMSAKQYEKQKVTQYIREIDPNDFEFQTIIREILSIIQNNENRIVVVIDNIDRLPRNEIENYWAMVRSIFCHSSGEPIGKHANIIAIVPYARHLIKLGESEDAEKETFSKTFSEILIVSPPILSNIREFFSQKFREALPSYNTPGSEFRLYMAFSKAMGAEAAKATPRKVIAFINEITHTYVLHQGKIDVPTIGVFHLLQDALEKEPSIIAKGGIDENVRNIAADPHLERNLAAILFNVETELALQVLLDGNIKKALLTSGDELVKLSKSPGFGFRIVRVFEDSLDEWLNEQTFAQILISVGVLIASYDGDETLHLRRSVVKGFLRVQEISVSRAGSTFLSILALASDEEFAQVLQHLCSAVLRQLRSAENLVESGERYAIFAKQLQEYLQRLTPELTGKDARKAITLPRDTPFVFGFLKGADNHFDDPKDFKRTLDTPVADVDFLQKIAIENSKDSLLIIPQLLDKAEIDDQWVFENIVPIILNAIRTHDHEDLNDFDDKFRLLTQIWLRLKSGRKASVDLEELLNTPSVLIGLRSSIVDYENGPIEELLLLSAHLVHQGKLSSSSKGGTQAAVAFEWLMSHFGSEAQLTDEQLSGLVRLVERADAVSNWLSYSASHSDSVITSRVLKAILAKEPTVFIQTNVLIRNYMYIRRLIVNDFRLFIRNSAFVDRRHLSFSLEELPVRMISDTWENNPDGWKKFHSHVEQLLLKIPVQDWRDHFVQQTHTCAVLIAKIATSGINFSGRDFGDQVADFASRILNGEVKVSEELLNSDRLLDGIDPGYRANTIRTIREQMKSSTAKTLHELYQLMPRIIDGLIDSPDTLNKVDKEKVVRFVLCPALEGGIDEILQKFEELKRKRVKDLLASSEPSTQEMIQSALEGYVKNAPLDKGRRMNDLINGRKATSLWSIWFPLAQEKDDDREDI